MKHESRRRGWLGLAVVLLAATLLAPGVAAQQPPAKGPEAKPAAAAKQAKKPRGRLPAYFGKVVTEKQKQEIYEIQARYLDEVTKLKKQLDDLLAKQRGEIEKVLTPEQQAEIEQLRAKRKSSRSGSASATTPAADGAGTR